MVIIVSWGARTMLLSLLVAVGIPNRVNFLFSLCTLYHKPPCWPLLAGKNDITIHLTMHVESAQWVAYDSFSGNKTQHSHSASWSKIEHSNFFFLLETEC